MGVADPSAYYQARPAAAEPAPERRRERDPLASVLALGDRTVRVGAALGIGVALLTHGGVAIKAVSALTEMRLVTHDMRAVLKEFFWTRYDVDVDRPRPKPKDEPPPPEPPPEPEPAPAPKAEAPKPKDPYDAPPAPAQAQKVLTAPDKPYDEPEDMTDRGFVSGEGDAPGYGMVSPKGTASAPTYNPNAVPGGKPGGTGTGPVAPPPPPPEVDRSKPPSILGSTDWNCPFPPEADADQVDAAVANVVVTVRPDGTAQAVKVVLDPGHGFGRAARMCALSRRYTPGLDKHGNPTTMTTAPIRVRFTR